MLNLLESGTELIPPMQDTQIPNEVRKGLFVYQVPTARWYGFSEIIAGRDDVLLYRNGVQINNPYRGRNMSRGMVEQKDASVVADEKYAAVVAEMETLKGLHAGLVAKMELMMQQSVTPAVAPPAQFTPA